VDSTASLTRGVVRLDIVCLAASKSNLSSVGLASGSVSFVCLAWGRRVGGSAKNARESSAQVG